MTRRSFDERMALRDTLLRLYCDEAKKRKDPDRNGVDRETGEIRWVKMEQEFMLGEINRRRGQLQKKPVSMEDYKRMEQLCIGHCDYVTKLALYSMEMVYDRE